MMRLTFCTLFDSNYLDKGLVLQKSLQKACNEYTLYILPMDRQCSEILISENMENVVIVDYADFEDEQLQRLKKERTVAEYCWTCTAKLIAYVLDVYHTDMCTYIDADMYFYHSPDKIIQEMFESGSVLQIIGHNFRKFEAKENETICGKYNVAFNTFLNEERARNVLNQWVEDCVKDCSYGRNTKVFGDQKYLNHWTESYPFLNVCKNLGGDVAPWNVNRFLFKRKGDDIYVIDRDGKGEFLLIFYHFQNILFQTEDIVHCCRVNKNMYNYVKSIYKAYLLEIKEQRKYLKDKYGLNIMIQIHPADASKPSLNRKNFLYFKEALKEKGVRILVKNQINNFKAKFIRYWNTKNEIELIIDLKEI